jgi:phosphatidylcholine synthase
MTRAFSLEQKDLTMRQKFLAWCAHAYTALGLVAAAAIAAAVFEGSPDAIHLAFALMVLATIIDATDGTLARAARVKEVLPHFDGRRLDDLIDFQTYTSLPLLLIWRAHLLPAQWEAWLLAPLVASAYGFCQSRAKTDDGFFLGFPSYWNIIAFYMYLLALPAAVNLAVLLLFAVLTFVPARYLYPTHRGRLNRYTNYLGAIWAALLIVIIWRLHDAGTTGMLTRGLVYVSLLFPAYYLLVSWAISLRLLLRARRLKHQQGTHGQKAEKR